MKKVLYLLAFITVGFASAQDFSSVVGSYLSNNHVELGLQPQDVGDISVNSQSFSKSMNLNNVYVSQRHQGIEVYNSASSFAVKNGNVVSSAISFVAGAAQKVNTTTPSTTASAAISSATSALGIPSPTNLVLLETVEVNSFVYSNGGVSLENIPVRLVYQKMEDGTLRLAWDLSIYLLDASHYYSVRMDAVSGTLLDTTDWVTSCTFGDATHNHFDSKDGESILFENKAEVSLSAAGGAQYRVFPMPVESPNHGSEALLPDPANAIASPFGWHDDDGVAGAEYTTTRGNNVLASEDIDGNNGVGAMPDGGAILDFDFPFDFTMQPSAYTDAATVNLFYWNNIIHDVLYQYGFDEDSGNFQANNYGNGGLGSDFVIADAQDGSGTNNANFSTPPDGARPRMQMFLWLGSSGPVADILTINNGPLAGIYSGVPAAFGGPIPTGLTEDLAVIEDDDAGASTDPNDGCDNVTNGPDLTGKIVVIRRGECEFGFKALSAETEGAIAVIIVNNVAGAPIVMAPGAVGASVTIPLFMVSDVDGDAIIAEINGGGTVNGTINGGAIVADRDGDVDNAIIVHEYGHGVSNRLTGGPGTTGCLNNAEQMGEGWSDYLGLMLTMEQGDAAGDVRGIGTYATFQPTSGGGIREAPYSTDFGVNDFTYADTNANVSQPHGIGFVWATMLWEMTWDIIAARDGGAIGDIYTGTAGNNVAMQLVMDGMKLQACSPGFIDGRDAILEADMIATGGEYRCLIWKAFARRGLGLSADQGSSASRSDQVEAFDLPTDVPTGDCPPLGVSDFALESNFSVYPNPSNGNINISSVIDAGDVKISIVDINGRIVFSEDMELTNTVNINAENLTSGIYIVQINGANYSHKAKLIIK